MTQRLFERSNETFEMGTECKHASSVVECLTASGTSNSFFSKSDYERTGQNSDDRPVDLSLKSWLLWQNLAELLLQFAVMDAMANHLLMTNKMQDFSKIEFCFA